MARRLPPSRGTSAAWAGRRPTGVASDGLPRGPARPLEILASHQSRSRSRAPRRLGVPQGYRGGGDRRLHPSGLARRARREARSRRARPLSPARRYRESRDGRAAGSVPQSGAVPARGRDFDDLQEGRAHPQNPPSDLCARSRDRGSHVGAARPHRQHRLRRASDPRPRFTRPLGNCARIRPARLSGAGAYLDAVVRGARIAVGIRFDHRVLRRPGGPHLRGRDRPVLRSADELADFVSRPLSAHVEFRRAFPRQARSRGDDLRLRPRLLRDQERFGDRPRLCGHGRVLSGRRQVSPRRPSQMRGAAVPAGDAPAWRTLSGLRRAADDRRRASGRGARRSQRGGGDAAGDRRPGLQPGAAAGNSLRDRRQRREIANGRAQLRSGDRQARRRAFDPAGGAGRGHRPRRLGAARRGDHAPARRQGDPRPRLRRRIRRDPPVRGQRARAADLGRIAVRYAGLQTNVGCSSFRGAGKTCEPGIHNHDRCKARSSCGYGFRSARQGARPE